MEGPSADLQLPVDKVLEHWHQLLADSGRRGAGLHSGSCGRRLGASRNRDCQQQEWLDSHHLEPDDSRDSRDHKQYEHNDFHNLPNLPNLHDITDYHHDFDFDDHFDHDSVDDDFRSRVVLSAVLDSQRLFGGRDLITELVAGVGPERIHGEFWRLLSD